MRVADLDRLAALARDVPMQAVSYAHTWDNLSRVATQLLS